MSKPDRTVKPADIAKVWAAVNAYTSVHVTPIGSICIEQIDGDKTNCISLWVDDLATLGEALLPLLDVAEAIRQRGAA